MDDAELLQRIQALVDEEHRLEGEQVGEGRAATTAARLAGLEVALDQCWDLLRQRRARRHAGQNPDEVEARPAGTVEGYQQ